VEYRTTDTQAHFRCSSVGEDGEFEQNVLLCSFPSFCYVPIESFRSGDGSPGATNVVLVPVLLVGVVVIKFSIP